MDDAGRLDVAKMDATAIAELYALIDSQQGFANDGLLLELCAEPSEADVIISNVRMRKRLERHLDWDIARQKAIVTPEWLRATVEQQHPVPCGEYAALEELHDETVQSCPACNLPVCKCSSSPPHAPPSTLPPTAVSAVGVPKLTTSQRILDNYKAWYACQRASPLVCPNQALATELGILRTHRDLEGKDVNALSYDRAIAIIKAFPRELTPENIDKELVQLPHVGEKIQSKIREFIRSGVIEEAQYLRRDERFQSLKAFTTIHGVGASTARTLYSIGLRTLEDMERYYDVPVDDYGNPKLEEEEPIFTPNGRRVPRTAKLPDLSIKTALALRHELAVPIPRDEVEEMHAIVMAELDQLQPGCISTIVGGHRRGKPESNDVDIVIGHSDIQNGGELIKGLCKRLVHRLYERGLVTHVTHLSGFHAHNALRTTHWDSLEKALCVFVLPEDGQQKRLHRRLDLIFAAPEAYWTAVVGWTGSKMFERDLRLWAKKEKGMKFDSSGMTRRHDSQLYFPRSEKQVFDLLGLEWIDPTLRNVDV
ncbi:putative DNA polymerase mu [Lyophyllum shimeji]|uniref:DNA polymerase n=1 Tax=Lyophyllum shimeji TaxID=47721 RepID=A0A9P3PKS2_LYOSH|nr:putative DNA polymerase mu [Lyophyllum shimeji]